MKLDTSERQLALLYLATVQGIAYGTRHIVEHCNVHGHKVMMLLSQYSLIYDFSIMDLVSEVVLSFLIYFLPS